MCNVQLVKIGSSSCSGCFIQSATTGPVCWVVGHYYFVERKILAHSLKKELHAAKLTPYSVRHLGGKCILGCYQFGQTWGNAKLWIWIYVCCVEMSRPLLSQLLVRMQVWMESSISIVINSVHVTNCFEWGCNLMAKYDMEQMSLFITICWCLWNNRNSFIFENKQRNADEVFFFLLWSM